MLVPADAAAAWGGSVLALVAQLGNARSARSSQLSAAPELCSVLVPTAVSPQEAGTWGPTGWLPGRGPPVGFYLQANAQPG